MLDRGLDAQTAFEIVSIDIADIDVGQNIGARLQADQAEADMRVARAKAEERRALALAREQEMKAQVARNRAEVVLAEAEVPHGHGRRLPQGQSAQQRGENLTFVLERVSARLRGSLGDGGRLWFLARPA